MIRVNLISDLVEKQIQDTQNAMSPEEKEAFEARQVEIRKLRARAIKDKAGTETPEPDLGHPRLRASPVMIPKRI